jgi:predicted DNA-binding transcriptional regulator AlpA
MNDRLLTYRDVTRETTLSEATVRRLIHAGRFPRPIPLGVSRRVAFLGSQVDSAMQALMAAGSSRGGAEAH